MLPSCILYIIKKNTLQGNKIHREKGLLLYESINIENFIIQLFNPALRC